MRYGELPRFPLLTANQRLLCDVGLFAQPSQLYNAQRLQLLLLLDRQRFRLQERGRQVHWSRGGFTVMSGTPARRFQARFAMRNHVAGGKGSNMGLQVKITANDKRLKKEGREASLTVPCDVAFGIVTLGHFRNGTPAIWLRWLILGLWVAAVVISVLTA